MLFAAAPLVLGFSSPSTSSPSSSSPLPVPPEWKERFAAGELLYTVEDPPDGLTPSIGNGYISGDAGCSVPSKLQPGSCGRIHLGGVFQGGAGQQKRADLVNPFAAVTAKATRRVGAALDLARGLYTNTSEVVCEDGRTTQVSLTTYAHRAHRSLLVLEIDSLLELNARCTIQLASCALANASADFVINATGPGSAQTLTVRTMETPPSWSNATHPTPTAAGYAADELPSEITLVGGDGPAIFVAAYRTSLEPGLEKPGAVAAAAAADLAAATSSAAARASLRASHLAAQRELWAGGIEIGGNATIARSVNSSLYYILSAARADWPYGLSPGGLSRNDYEGHSFWDCETWMLPSLVALFPALAASLVEYRSTRLPAARARAAHHNLSGAMQPWESALLGFGVSSWVDADEHEIHISGDVPMAFRLYHRMSRNASWLRTHGWPVARDSADFFCSRAVRHNVSGNWTLLNVIMPDEGAGVRNGSAYTNAVAAETMRFAAAVAKTIGAGANPLWLAKASSMHLPVVELQKGLRVHPEFDGYTTKVRPNINQADVALMQYPLGLPMDTDVAKNDLLFYQERSSGPGTAGFYTGDSAYSIAWLQLGNRSAADAQFDLAFEHMDLAHFNVWEEKSFGNLGNLNFVTGAGGFLQNFVFGYAGLRYDDAGASLQPVLPPHGVTSLKLRAVALGTSRVTLEYDARQLTATLLSGAPVRISDAASGGGGASRVLSRVGVPTVFALAGATPKFTMVPA